MQHAADLIPHVRAGAVGQAAEISEGPRWEIVVSPGVFRVRTRDYARAERTHERAVKRCRKNVDVAAIWEGEMPDALPTRGTITAWTPRSRVRLVAALADLDYTRLYGRFHIWQACQEEYDDELTLCPKCRSTWRTTETGRTCGCPKLGSRQLTCRFAADGSPA